ncbi:MAG TPA: GNAT family N-acetyltransferase [Frankiaceae bacterium]|nr:GNAT family N-acetyltransferase [Frankiaceae bacterium]
MPLRRIREDEWQRWRDFRYAMLSDAPNAFGMTYADAIARPDDDWRTRTRDLATTEHTTYVVVEEDGEWLAGAGGYVEDGIPNVFGVWTHPDARGRGLAEQCVQAIVDWAAGLGAAEVRLWATDGNDAARRVYDRLGFTPTGATQPLPHTPELVESEYARPLGTADASAPSH